MASLIFTLCVLFLTLYVSSLAFSIPTNGSCECDCSVIADLEQKLKKSNITFDERLTNASARLNAKFSSMRLLLDEIELSLTKSKKEKMSMSDRVPAMGPLDSAHVHKKDQYTELKKLVRPAPFEAQKPHKHSVEDYRGREPATEQQMKERAAMRSRNPPKMELNRSLLKDPVETIPKDVMEKLSSFNTSVEEVIETKNKTLLRRLFKTIANLKKTKEVELDESLRVPASEKKEEL